MLPSDNTVPTTLSSSSSTHIPRHRATVEEVEDEDMPSSTSPHNQFNSASNISTPRSRNEVSDADRHPLGEPLKRPSEYLRKRCPLCFGGEQIHDPTAMYVSKV
jgi:hypothetical protein